MNHAMIDEARRRTADLGGAVRCQVGDVQRLELGDDAVDGVRTERVLMYVPDRQRAIGELARVVRPGGRVVAFELDYGATLVDLPDHGAAQRVLDALGHTVAHRWMGRALARAFHQAGLRRHRCRTATHRAAARDPPPARRPGPGRRGRVRDTRGSRLPALAGGGAGRRAWRVPQRHVRRDGRVGPQAGPHGDRPVTRHLVVGVA
jgi:SAM-dependent methyltransferase